VTSRTAQGCATALRAGSEPTRPGWSSPPWPTTCCAGSPPSGWARAACWSPRPSAAGCCTCPVGSPSSARQHLLHLPTDWPWAAQFLRALARLRAVPLRARRRAATPTPRTAGRPRASLPGVRPTRTVGAAGALRTAPARARPATPATQTTRPAPDRRPNGGSRPPTRATVDPGLAKALACTGHPALVTFADGVQHVGVTSVPPGGCRVTGEGRTT
jgi:hypothetical protein